LHDVVFCDLVLGVIGVLVSRHHVCRDTARDHHRHTIVVWRTQRYQRD
jgi:hypothetical protein